MITIHRSGVVLVALALTTVSCASAHRVTVPVRLGVVVPPNKRQVTVRGEHTALTKLEFDLLQLLILHPGIAFSREALMARVWRAARHVTARTVDAVVSRLRREIECDPTHPRLILTVWGIGYRFADVS